MSMNIAMKKVAGFHSFDLGFLTFDTEPDFRRGLGTRSFQNEADVTLTIVRWLAIEGRWV